MGVPSHDVSDIEMEAALIAASDGHRTKLMELLTGTDDERVSIVINKLDRSAPQVPIPMQPRLLASTFPW